MSRPANHIRTTVAAMLLAAVTGCGPVEVSDWALPGRGSSGDEAVGSAAEALARLPVKGRAPKTGYDRRLFGDGWADTDEDGCSTRGEILARDATATTLGPDGCVDKVEIVDPYSGLPVLDRADIDIDHVVALGDAWQSGAQQLDSDDREWLANDPLNLLAVSDVLNRRKSDANAASWLPPAKSYRCRYVARQVAVKAAHGLWVTAPERDAIARVLADCPGEPLPTSLKGQQ